MKGSYIERGSADAVDALPKGKVEGTDKEHLFCDNATRRFVAATCL